MKKICGNCEHTDGCIYTSNPPKIKCTITGKFHYQDDICDREEATSLLLEPYKPYITQGWLCPRCGKINAPWMGQCNCSGKPMEITCGSVEKGVLSPGYYTTVIPTSYPISYSTSTTSEVGARSKDFVTLTGEPSDEAKELLRKWRKDPAANDSIKKTEEK